MAIRSRPVKTPFPGPGTDGASQKVLVVDDEPAMVGVIGAILGAAGHRIVAAYDGLEAVRRFREEDPDLVLLDLAMPGLDGAMVCREIRAISDAPIIVVSGESDLAVTVELLEAGADDYLRKPFRGEELLARTRAVLRRARRTPLRGAWTLDRTRHEVRWRGAPLPLTVTEFRLLSRLIGRIGEVVESVDRARSRSPVAQATPGEVAGEAIGRGRHHAHRHPGRRLPAGRPGAAVVTQPLPARHPRVADVARARS